jgi:uncharacterized membrane protein
LNAAPSSKATRPRRKPHRLQAFFVRGLITVLPLLFTVFILMAAFRFVDGYVTGPVNTAIYWSLEENGAGWKALELLGIDPRSEEYLADQFPRRLAERIAARRVTSADPAYLELVSEWRRENEGFLKDLDELAIDREALHAAVALRIPPVVGLVVSVLLVLTLGSFAGGLLGRTLLARGDRMLARVPLVGSIYPYAKQLVDFFLAERSFEFDTAVAVPYPRKGLYSLGFVTSASFETLRRATGKNLITVFVPSSPMPMTGYSVFVPAEELVPLPISVDEALRTIVSGGVLIPPHEMPALGGTELLAQARRAEMRVAPADASEVRGEA